MAWKYYYYYWQYILQYEKHKNTCFCHKLSFHFLPFSQSDVCSVSVLLVFCHLWSWSSEPWGLLQTKRHWTCQTGSMWCSPASCHGPAMPNCRMHTLHLGCWRVGRSKYRLILSLSSYVHPHPHHSQSPMRKMNRWFTILLRFLLAEISALPLFLCTIKWTTCRYPCTLVNREGFGDYHQSVNYNKLWSTDGHHPFCPAEYHCSVSR